MTLMLADGSAFRRRIRAPHKFFDLVSLPCTSLCKLIGALHDWRGEALAKVRKIIHDAKRRCISG